MSCCSCTTINIVGQQLNPPSITSTAQGGIRFPLTVQESLAFFGVSATEQRLLSTADDLAQLNLPS